MLELLQALALRLSWLRLVSVLISGSFGALFTYAALTAGAPESFFTSGLAGLSWGLLLFTFLSVFRNVPGEPDPRLSRWQAFGIRVRRIGYGILAFATAALTVGVLALTVKFL